VAVERVDRLMSFHDPASQLSELNRNAALAPLRVDPWTYAVLVRAQRVAEASHGLFDITVAPAIIAQGLLPDPGMRTSEAGCWRDVVLLDEGRVWFTRPLLIDLGGIAKGFAVDRAIQELRASGCKDAIVNAGGDLRAFGDEPRPIHLRRSTGLVQVAELRVGAIATSSPHTDFPDRLAQPLGAIVRPHTGERWNAAGGVMVAARSCVMADALTKVAALAGPECRAVLARFGAQAYWDVEDN
jgi:thiamine biosynthesis lipoprotein